MRAEREAAELAQARARARAESAAKAAALIERQRRLRSTLQNAARTAQEALHGVPAALLQAERDLDVAEREFADRAFEPFWDALTRATQGLGTANAGLARIPEEATRFLEAAREADGPVPTFTVSVGDTKVLRKAIGPTADRLASVLRTAQKDYEFTQIGLQRKTNDILVAGFSSVTAAIGAIGGKIVAALDGIAVQLDAMEAGMRERHADLTERLDGIAGQFEGITDAVLASSRAASRERERIDGRAEARWRATLDMLDNIQRNRRPLPSERGTRRIL